MASANDRRPEAAVLREGTSGSTWTVASINAWNRIAISFRGVHGPYQPTRVTSHPAGQRGQDALNETMCTTTPTGHATFGSFAVLSRSSRYASKIGRARFRQDGHTG